MGLVLNPEQQAALDTREGVIVCIAGPGSGKTTVISKRFVKLLESGVSPDDILSLTFTHQAAAEMGERAGLAFSSSVFRTFHSYCLSILKRYRECLPFSLSPEIVGSPHEIFELVCEIRNTVNRSLQYKDIVEAVSEFKRAGVTPIQAIAQAEGGVDSLLAMAYRDYERKSRIRGWLDFDSIIAEAVNLLETNGSVRSACQFQFVQADECQDTDINQFRLLQLITQRHKNIFVVGDENQLIYEWRNARPGSLSSFSTLFPGARKLFLGTNYRSTKALVSFFKGIVPVDNGLASHMQPGPSSEEGFAPSFTQYKNATEEVEKVLASIKDPEKTAIVARTNRLLWEFERACSKRNIKYRLLGKVGFWDQSEVQRLLKLVKEAEPKLRTLPAGAAVKQVIEESRILQTYRIQPKFGEKDPAENINNAYLAAERFATIEEFLRHAQKASFAWKNRSGLILSTVHQMKGKEADHVYLVSACHGILPHDKGELPEERRIFFVACTRAAKFLHISYYDQPSMFILPFIEKNEHRSFADLQKAIPGNQPTLFGEAA